MKKSKVFNASLVVGMSMFTVAMLSGCGSDYAPAAQPPVVTQPAPVVEAPTEADVVQVQAPVDTTPAVASATFTPGTFTGTAPSFYGDLTVDVTFEENRIVSIDVDHSDTPAFARRAVPTVPQMIVHRQSTQDIDVIASATMTSTAVLEAVNDAIEQAGVSPSDLTPVIPTHPAPGATFIAGQHIVETESWTDAPMIMQVIFSEDEIVRVEVLEHGDTVVAGNWAGRAIPILPQQIEEVQSTAGIDIVAGATTTSSSVLRLVNEAITLAGANPASLPQRARVAGEFWPYGAGGGAQAIFHPGVYYASGTGFGPDPLVVQAIFSRGRLERVAVVEHSETESFFSIAFPSEQGAETLATIVQDGQTIQDLDVTAGATRTHEAFIEAVSEAIRMAGANPDDF